MAGRRKRRAKVQMTKARKANGEKHWNGQWWKVMRQRSFAIALPAGDSQWMPTTVVELGAWRL